MTDPKQSPPEGARAMSAAEETDVERATHESWTVEYRNGYRRGADSLRAPLDHAIADLTTAEAEVASLRAENERLEGELLTIAEATGYVNRAEGQDGYERKTGAALAESWLAERAENERLRAKVCEQEEDITRHQGTADTLRAELEKARADVRFLESDCAPGTDCHACVRCCDAALATAERERKRAEEAEAARADALESAEAWRQDLLRVAELVEKGQALTVSTPAGEDLIEALNGLLATRKAAEALVTSARESIATLTGELSEREAQVATLTQQRDALRAELEKVARYHAGMVHGEDCPSRDHQDDGECEDCAGGRACSDCECCLGVALIAERALASDSSTPKGEVRDDEA